MNGRNGPLSLKAKKIKAQQALMFSLTVKMQQLVESNCLCTDTAKLYFPASFFIIILGKLRYTNKKKDIKYFIGFPKP